MTKLNSPYRTININTRVSSTTTLAYTGVSVEIPANKMFGLLFQVMYSNSRGTQIVVTQIRDNLAGDVVRNDNGGGVSISGYFAADTTLYVYGKWSSAAQNDVRIRGWIEN